LSLARSPSLSWIWGAVVLAALTTGVGRTALAAPTLEDLHYNDQVSIALVRGGELEGRVLGSDGEVLLVVTDEGRLWLELLLVDRIEVLVRTSAEPLPVLEVPVVDDSEDAEVKRHRAMRRANGLAVASFFLPGIGQFANGQRSLGATYLLGVLTIDALAVLAVVLNTAEPVVVVLGGLDVAARISSAGLAYRDARPIGMWAMALPGRDSWALAAGISFRL